MNFSTTDSASGTEQFGQAPGHRTAAGVAALHAELPLGCAAQLSRLGAELRNSDGGIDGWSALCRGLTLMAPLTDGVYAASLSSRQGERWTTPAVSEGYTPIFEDAVYRCRQGPCLDADRFQRITVVSAWPEECRWRCLAALLADGAAPQSVLSMPLLYAGHAGQVLNLYSRRPRNFDGEQLRAATLATSAFAVLLTAVELRQDVANLQAALMTNRRIGEAVGILMANRMYGEGEAFAALRIASQHLHIKLSDVAEEVIYTGAVPPLPERGQPGTHT